RGSNTHRNGNGAGSGHSPTAPAPPPAPPPPPPPTLQSSVNPVVIMLQENRSFDEYFGQMTVYRKSHAIPIVGTPATINDLSTGAYSNISPATHKGVASYHSGSVCTEDLTPDWSESHKMMNLADPVHAGTDSPM